MSDPWKDFQEHKNYQSKYGGLPPHIPIKRDFECYETKIIPYTHKEEKYPLIKKQNDKLRQRYIKEGRYFIDQKNEGK